MTAKPLELASWNFERMFTPHHMSCVMFHASCVTCHVSCVTCQVSCDIFSSSFSFLQSGAASRWRVCFQRGLPQSSLFLNQKKFINSRQSWILLVLQFLKLFYWSKVFILQGFRIQGGYVKHEKRNKDNKKIMCLI